MVNTKDNLHAFELMKDGLLQHLKEELEESLVNDLMNGVETKIREIVRKYIAKITFDDIVTYRQWAEMRDEFRLIVHINDEEPIEKIGERQRYVLRKSDSE